MFVDKVNKSLVKGECKYMKKPMSASVFYNLIKKTENIKDYEDQGSGTKELGLDTDLKEE